MSEFRRAGTESIENAIKLIGKDWMLITVKDGDGANAMTASWGCLGELWHKPVAVCFVRPQRYTFGLTEEQDRFSLAFFDEEYREALRICGTKSGRDCDKLALSGLSCSEIDGVSVINEAKMVLICRKLYADYLREESFLDKSVLDNYKLKDYHRVYVAEIEQVLVKD